MTQTITLSLSDAADRADDATVLDRWQPARAGLVNVWRYADEVLHFHRGRLLLRGPNGSGKSMALELLLPFLLDANASPHRLTSAAKSRGGLYDRLIGEGSDSAKVGFLWVEFRRARIGTMPDSAASDGTAAEARDPSVETCTIGVRLRASASTRQVDKHWFVTPQVVGCDLNLLDEARHPLGAAALAETVAAGGGHAFDDATAYRTRVRETLFEGFGQDQYDALVGALLALRQEKLSQHLDVQRLSDTLSMALPPLDEREVGDAAEGFRQLDQRQDNLDQLASDVEALARLGQRQRRYARLLVRSTAATVISAQTASDRITRREREVTQQHEATQERDAKLVLERRQIADRVAQIAGALDVLRNRDAYKAGATLAALAAETRRADAAVKVHNRRASDAAAEADQLVEQAREAADRAATAGEHLHRAEVELVAAAQRAGADAILDMALGDASQASSADQLLRTWGEARRGQIAAVRLRLGDHHAAVRDRDRATERVEQAERRRDRHADDLASRLAGVETLIAELRRELRRWLQSLVVLDAAALDDVPTLDIEDLRDVAGPVAKVVAARRDDLSRQDAAIAAHDEVLAGEMGALQERRDRLATAVHPEPVAPAWRRDRSDRHGWPLWQLVEFHDDVDAAVRDRTESALTTAGLLDAWIAPDGTIELDPALPDTFVVRTTASLVASAEAGEDAAGPDTLAALLRPETDVDPGPAKAVTSILSAIAVLPSVVESDDAESPAVIGLDGSFRLALLTGIGPERPAGFIGATARASERQRQLSVIDARLAELRSSRDELAAARQALAATRSALADEADAMPSPAALLAAEHEVALAEQRLADADRHLADEVGERGQAEDAVRLALRELTATAADHGLPTMANLLDEVEDGLTQLGSCATAWGNRRREHASATQVAEAKGDEADRAARQRAERDDEAADAVLHHAGLAARLATLEETVGDDYRSIVEQINLEEAEQSQLGERDEQVVEERRVISGIIAGLLGDLERIAIDREKVDGERDAVMARIGALVRDGLTVDGDLGALQEPSGWTAALELARTLAANLEGLESDDKAVARAQQRVGESLHDTGQKLGGRVDLTFRQTDQGWWLLRATTDGVEATVIQLHGTLTAQLQTARDEFAEHERELYDRTLTEGLRRHLVGRMRRASELTDRINRQLERVRTDAGVGVRLEWVIDDESADDTIAKARPLLLRAPADLQPGEAAALHDFLRARVDVVRDVEAGHPSWEERLQHAFDYRDWHRFRLRVSHDAWGGEFREATTRRLAQLSTGERSVVLHLPMLASVSAHYDADEQAAGCPRLILLDELFVGVDPVNRAKLFGMFVEWDLDAVLTSDHEWCRYASLDGIAIHQVHADAESVVTTRFQWDGTQGEMTAAIPA